MREVEKNEGNYMSLDRDRSGTWGDRTEATNRPTKGQTKTFLVISDRGGKKQKKKCAMFIIHEVFMLLSTTLL